MLGKFPMGDRWAAELFAAVLPPSRLKNVRPHQGDAVAHRLVRVWWSGANRAGFSAFTERVRAAFLLLDNAFEHAPEPMALIVDQTFELLRDLLQRESSLDAATRVKHDDNLQARFAAQLAFYEFLHESFHRTLGASYVIADALTRTDAGVSGLIDDDGKVARWQIAEVEKGRGLRSGMLTAGIEPHLRNCAAHHLYRILDDTHIELKDVDPRTGQVTWGPVVWTHWELHTNVRRLFTTCSVLLISLGCFHITNGRTIRARGWGTQEPLRQKRRDIVKAELYGPADCFGFSVESVQQGTSGALEIGLRVKGDTVIEQKTLIITGGAVPFAYERHVRTEWAPLRSQVYGFLQISYDIHGAYEVLRVTVTSRDGQQQLGQIQASLDARHAMLSGEETVEAMRARLAVDTLADQDMPVVLEGPIVPAS